MTKAPLARGLIIKGRWACFARQARFCGPGFGAACGPIERSCGGYETSLPSDPQFIVELLTGGVGVVGATSPDGFGLSLVRDRSR